MIGTPHLSGFRDELHQPMGVGYPSLQQQRPFPQTQMSDATWNLHQHQQPTFNGGVPLPTFPNHHSQRYASADIFNAFATTNAIHTQSAIQEYRILELETRIQQMQRRDIDAMIRSREASITSAFANIIRSNM
jgi:hypothetical protein